MLPAKFALRLSGKNGTPPFTAFSSIDASAYGQLTSSAAFPCSNASRAVPASVRVTEGSAPGAVATDFMICNALTVAVRCAGVSVRVTVLPSSESTWPPALSSSVLNQTTTPSFWLACTPIQLGPPAACSRAASASTPLQVSGGLSIKSGRYQSNWVFVLRGAAYNRCRQIAVLNGPGKVSVVASASARRAGSSDSGSIQPASAHSAGQLHSLVIGAPRQADLPHGEPSTQLVGAALGHRGERRGVAGRGVKADHPPAVTGSTGRYRWSGGQQRQRDRPDPACASATSRHESDGQARKQIPSVLSVLRVAENVVSAGHQLQRGTEVAGTARHRVRNRRGDEAEEHSGDQTGGQRLQRVGAGEQQGQNQADEEAQPGAADHAAAQHFRPGQPPGDPLDLHQVHPDDRHLLHRELLIGQVVHGTLRFGVRGVRTDRPAFRRGG